MGACLDPRPDMGAYSVEVRRESAYLNGPTRVRRDPGGFVIPTADVPAVMSALAQIMEHPAYTEWLAAWESDTTPWVTEQTRPEWLELTGPAVYYAESENRTWWEPGTVELPYEQLEPLRAALGGVVRMPNDEERELGMSAVILHPHSVTNPSDKFRVVDYTAWNKHVSDQGATPLPVLSEHDDYTGAESARDTANGVSDTR